MKMVCISDTHCKLDQVDVPDGDILVHAGDSLSRGTYSEWLTFLDNFTMLPHKHKIFVPGNHDRITEQNESLIKEECEAKGVIYLNDSGHEIEGVKFWGSGITPRFHNWAWNRDSGDGGTSYRVSNPEYDPIQKHWDKIPDDIDVLITHGPPKGVLDVSVYNGDYCGCQFLLAKVKEIKPKYHIFGHIHNWHGKIVGADTTFINASICTEAYEATNIPIIVEIDND